MRIEDFLEKKERLQVIILQQLVLAEGSMDFTTLREYLAISKSSLEVYLSEIQDYLSHYPAQAKLDFDTRTVTLELTKGFSLLSIYHDYLKNSLKIQLIDYLYHEQEFTVVQITTDLLISESTLFRKIKELNSLLKEFNLQIKNGSLHGEELQIRYFYFQLYSFMTSYQELEQELAQANNQRILRAFENELQIKLSTFNRMRCSLWLSITRKRARIPNKEYKQVRKKIKIYEADSFYKRVRRLVFLYLSRYSIEVGEEEGMLHFIFLTTQSVLSEEDFSNYDLLRNRRTPTARTDTLLRETVLLHYRPRKPSIALEKKLNYYVSQVNGLLYFYQGYLEINLPEEESLTPVNLLTLSEELLALALSNFSQGQDGTHTLGRISLAGYRHILAIIDHDISKPLKVGIELKLIELERERITQLIRLDLKHVTGVKVEVYQATKEYDLIITNTVGFLPDNTARHVYLLSDAYSTFDLKGIKKEIQRIKEHS